MDASPDRSHPGAVMEHAYAALIRDARRKPFAWGSHDCVLFAASAVRVRTGRDALAELGLSATWTNEEEAVAAVAAAGGYRFALTRIFGEPVPILRARIGDLALANDPERGGRELMSVVHAGFLLVPSMRGLFSMPLSTAVAAWRVA